MSGDIEQKVEKLIDEKIDESDESVDREHLKEEILDELESQSEQEKQTLLDKVSEDKISRRGFLKTLGLGAGGLALSSTVSGAWAQWQASTQGRSDINADTVDGQEASDLGGKTLQRDRNGDALITSTNVLSTTFQVPLKTTNSFFVASAATTVTESVKVSGVTNSSFKMYVKNTFYDKGDNNWNPEGWGTIKINGNTVAQTNYSGSDDQNGGQLTITTSTTRSLASDVVTLRARGYEGGSPAIKIEGTLSAYGTTTGNTNVRTTPTGSNSLAFLNWKTNNPGGINVTGPKFNGSNIPSQDRLYDTIDSNDTLSFYLSWNGLTNSSTFNGTFSIYNGTTI